MDLSPQRYAELEAEERARQEIRRQIAPPRPEFSRGTAAVLSLVFPGAGQLYKSGPADGIGWWLATVLGYLMLIIPGLVIHFVCVCDASHPSKLGFGNWVRVPAFLFAVAMMLAMFYSVVSQKYERPAGQPATQAATQDMQ